jgi:hypothetical protein
LINRTIIIENHTLRVKQLQTSLDPVQNGFWLKHGFQSNDFSVLTFRLHKRFRTKYLCMTLPLFPISGYCRILLKEKWQVMLPFPYDGKRWFIYSNSSMQQTVL